MGRTELLINKDQGRIRRAPFRGKASALFASTKGPPRGQCLVRKKLADMRFLDLSDSPTLIVNLLRSTSGYTTISSHPQQLWIPFLYFLLDFAFMSVLGFSCTITTITHETRKETITFAAGWRDTNRTGQRTETMIERSWRGQQATGPSIRSRGTLSFGVTFQILTRGLYLIVPSSTC